MRSFLSCALLMAAVSAADDKTETSTYEGAGVPLKDEDGKTIVDSTLRYEFTRTNAGQSDETIMTKQTTTVKNEIENFGNSIIKQRSCVDWSVEEPKYLCFDYELYVQTFYAVVRRSSNTTPLQ